MKYTLAAIAIMVSGAASAACFGDAEYVHGTTGNNWVDNFAGSLACGDVANAYKLANAIDILQPDLAEAAMHEAGELMGIDGAYSAGVFVAFQDAGGGDFGDFLSYMYAQESNNQDLDFELQGWWTGPGGSFDNDDAVAAYENYLD